MKIVLVDDEQWIVTGLARILNKQYPDMQIRTYTNPLQALGEIAGDMPDLMITDIHMPQMNGLHLIEQVRALGLRFYAVLTGLDDIELVKQSIWLQVADYLIKPVNKSELFHLVNHVEEQLADIRHRAKEELPDLLRLCAAYGREIEALQTLAATYRTALVVRFSGTRAALPPDAAVFFSLSVELWRLEQCCWLYLSTQKAPAELESILQKDSSILSFRISLFDPAQLHNQFLGAMSAGDDLQSNAVALYYSTPQRYTEVAESLLRQMIHDPCPPMVLDTFCAAVSLQFSMRRAIEITYDCIHGRMDALALADALRSLPPVVMPHSADVRLTLQWVQEHYAGTITLVQAAANVYLQANYFTTLFRKEMNVSFIQYLNELRIDKACRFIMEHPDASFEEVAQKNGFTSLRHFYSMFKKCAGQTPGEYRQFLLKTGFVR